MQSFLSLFGADSPATMRKKKAEEDAANFVDNYVSKFGEETGNRVYTLQRNANEPNDPARPLRFIAFGCQGSGSEYQKKVAALLNQACADPATRPDFILVLGDNIYSTGASSANDPNIKKCIDNIYQTDDLPFLKNVPMFFLLGNHDENVMELLESMLHLTETENGVPRSLHEVAYSYMPDQNLTVKQKIALYEKKILALNQLPSYNMPRRYYSLILGDVQIFMIDSNTYVSEYVHWLENPQAFNANNQAAWLAQEVAAAKAAGRKVLLAEHHPLASVTKHAYKSDFSNYGYKGDYSAYVELDDMQLAEKHLKLPMSLPYIQALRECYKHQGLVFDMILTAHDHNMYYYNNNHDDCDVLCTELAPFINCLDALPIRSNAAYIRNDDDLYYVNKAKNTCERIDIPFPVHEKLQQFDEKFKPEKQARTLQPEELGIIAKLVGHQHGDNYPLRQLTVGSGGGKPQRRVKFNTHNNIGAFIRNYGFAVITHIPGTNDFEFTLQTVDRNPQPMFNNHSCAPLIHFANENERPAIELFFKTVEKALQGYETFLGEKQEETNGKFFSNNASHGKMGAQRADNIWAYIRRPYPRSFAEIIRDVYNLTDLGSRWTSPSPNSLITYLDKEMLAVYGKNFSDFSSVPCRPLPPRIAM